MTKFQLCLTALLVLLTVSLPFIASAISGTSVGGTIGGTGTGANGRISIRVNGSPKLYGPQILDELLQHSRRIRNADNTIVSNEGIVSIEGVPVPIYPPPPGQPFLWVTPQEAATFDTAIDRATAFNAVVPTYGWFVAPPRGFDIKRQAPPVGEPPQYDLRYNYNPHPNGPSNGTDAWTMWDDFNIGFVPGETFTLELDMEGMLNPDGSRDGFSFNAMLITMTLPPEIDLVFDAATNRAATSTIPGFDHGPMLPNPDVNYNYGRDDKRVVLGWPVGAGLDGENHVNVNGSREQIMQINLRISDAITFPNGSHYITEPITFAFQNRIICDEPTRFVNGVQEPIDLWFVYNNPIDGSQQRLPSTPCNCTDSYCSGINPVFSTGGVLIRPQGYPRQLP